MHLPKRTARILAGRAKRQAYTLLEVLLAASIGMLLLAALYVAMDVQLRHARIGRSVVEDSTLARALLARMERDIAPSVGPVDPSRFRTSSSQGSNSSGQPGSSTNQQSGSNPSSGTSNSSSSSTTSTSNSSTSSGTNGSSSSSSSSNNSSSSSSSSSNSTSSSSNSSSFIFTVQGDTGRLTIFTSRLPHEWDLPGTPPPDAPTVISDLRRISYWLFDGGLARQELVLATSDDATNPPPDTPDNYSKVLASEVKSLTFSYFDGNDWQDSWDGTTTGSDGMTPIGPPLAIAITVGIQPSDTGTGDNGDNLKYYRHVIPIATANGATQASASNQ